MNNPSNTLKATQPEQQTAHQPEPLLIAYCRVSTGDDQAESKGQSTTQQANWAREQGVPDANIYRAVIGGTDSLTGPVWAQVLDRIAQARAEGRPVRLHTVRLDRISRHQADLPHTVWHLLEHGDLTIITKDREPLTAETLSDPLAFFRTNLESLIAAQERSLISKRTRDALRAKKAAGLVLGRPERLTPDDKATILRLRAEHHWGAQRIANHLNDQARLARRKANTSKGLKDWTVSRSAVQAVIHGNDPLDKATA